MVNIFHALPCPLQSYGVLCHEVFTGGCKPYQDMDNETVLRRVNAGYRLECPAACPDQVYQGVMKRCWDPAPEQRPTFSQLAGFLFSRVRSGSSKMLLKRLSAQAVSAEGSSKQSSFGPNSTASEPVSAPSLSEDSREYLGLIGSNGMAIAATAPVNAENIPLMPATRSAHAKPLPPPRRSVEQLVEEAQCPALPVSLRERIQADDKSQVSPRSASTTFSTLAPKHSPCASSNTVTPVSPREQTTAARGIETLSEGGPIEFEEEDDLLYI